MQRKQIILIYIIQYQHKYMHIKLYMIIKNKKV